MFLKIEFQKNNKMVVKFPREKTQNWLTKNAQRILLKKYSEINIKLAY